VPIPKGRNNNLFNSSNFRGIALSPVYGKIYVSSVGGKIQKLTLQTLLNLVVIIACII